MSFRKNPIPTSGSSTTSAPSAPAEPTEKELKAAAERQALAVKQAQTLARLQQITHQFESRAGTGRFAGKVAIMTGVGSVKGIGRASARLFAKEGARHLYILDYMGDGLAEFGQELEGLYPGLKVTAITADAASEQVIQDLCARAIKEEGRLDCFFANAGTIGGITMENTSAKVFEKTMSVNGFSCFLAVKYGSEAMKHVSKEKGEGEGGSIILTASVAGLRSGAGPVDYSMSKASVINLAHTSAQLLGGTNIRVNAILPGLIETGMTSTTFETARGRGTLGKVGQLNPMRRFGVAEEIAGVVLFLAGDEASYVNGVALPVDGGLSSSLPVVPGKFM